MNKECKSTVEKDKSSNQRERKRNDVFYNYKRCHTAKIVCSACKNRKCFPVRGAAESYDN